MKGLARGIAALAFLVTGCTALIGEDFAGYVMTGPTLCDPRSPQDADPQKFHRCPAGTTCVFASTDGSPSPRQTNCFSTVDPPLAPLAPCTALNDCGTARLCTGLGCAEYCTVGNLCSGDRPCLALSPRSWLGMEEIGYCAFDECNPLDLTCAGTCSFYTVTKTACVVTSGKAALGDSCAFDLDCKRTLACSDTTLKCTHYCRLGAFLDCPGGKACTEPATYLVWNGRAYGYCAL